MYHHPHHPLITSQKPAGDCLTWPTSGQVALVCRASSSQAAVANRAAAVTNSFQLRPPSVNPPAASRRPSHAAPPPSAATASAAPPAAAPAGAPAKDSAETAEPAADGVSDRPLTQGQYPQSAAATQAYTSISQPTHQQSHRRHQASNTHQQQQQQQQQPQAAQQDTLSLHPSDVYSPLAASAPSNVSRPHLPSNIAQLPLEM